MGPGDLPALPETIELTPPPRPPVTWPKVSFSVDKNAKAGESFQAGLWAEGGNEVEIIEVLMPGELGLHYDAAQRQLVGTPALAGDHTLTIHYRFAGSGADHPKLEGRCTLIVNPDPRALWKNLPSDQTAPDWKPDTDHQRIHTPHGPVLLAASQRGRSHAHVGGFRDDDFFLGTMGEWSILAVADGAGSAQRSRRGAQLATRRAGAFIKDKLSGEEGPAFEVAIVNDSPNAKTELYKILGGAAFEAVKAIQAEAVSHDLSAKDYATTLLLAIHKPTPIGHLIAAFWVGDGAVAVYRQGNEVNVLGESDSGEFAGQTRFLDQSAVSSWEAIAKRLRYAVVPDFTALALMTDGVSDPKFGTDRDLADLGCWESFWQDLAPALSAERPDAALLAWLDFWSQGNHDDRTLALLLC